MTEPLVGNGDFRSQESLDVLKECDIVITNPPFSLIKEFQRILIEFDKQFAIIAPQTSMKYYTIAKDIVEGKVEVSSFRIRNFCTPENKIKQAPTIVYYRYLAIPHKPFVELTKKYSNEHYPEYENTRAINIPSSKDIPKDYDGFMGVPISFLTKINRKQFKIFTISDSKFLYE